MKTFRNIAFGAVALISSVTASASTCAFCTGTETTSTTPSYTPSSSTTCYFCGNSSSSAAVGGSVTFAKAQTLTGYYVDDSDEYAGTVTLKLGKISKSGMVKVSATLKSRAGKKYTKSATVEADAENGYLSGTLAFSSSSIGAMSFEVQYDEDAGGMVFSGSSDNGYTMQTGSVSGSTSGLSGSSFSVNVDMGDFEPAENYDLISDPPTDQVITINSKGKFVTGSAPKVSYKKVKEDGETYYELTGLDDESANVAALSGSYSAKKGTFKGSFKVYASNEASIDSNKKPKIKTYKISFKGTIADGVGIGTGTIKVGKNKYTVTVEIVPNDSEG